MRFWTALKTVPDGIMSTADCCRQTVSMSKSIRTGTRNIVSGTRAYTQTLATMRRHIRTFRYRDWSSRSMLTQRVRSADAGWVLLRTKSRRWKPRCTAIRFPTSAVHGETSALVQTHSQSTRRRTHLPACRHSCCPSQMEITASMY